MSIVIVVVCAARAAFWHGVCVHVNPVRVPCHCLISTLGNFRYAQCWSPSSGELRDDCSLLSVGGARVEGSYFRELVLGVSYPRSGSTWLYQAVEEVSTVNPLLPCALVFRSPPRRWHSPCALCYGVR